ncbi:IS66 family insertion sequence element accessory protein TnpA [Marinomonas sp. IMCC 4694]|uniref:IS66 family insertion sequence element accessory protein TnpA n=1 Tax=Marinomonas sp. IMCC 4694 TaxID=2605432 RepID=UPI001652CC86|nr:hypothetical protein [Marinomonas sp. IMCC 4694]
MTKPYTRRSSSEWQKIIEDQAESGLSAPQYCKRHQVSVSVTISTPKTTQSALLT